MLLATVVIGQTPTANFSAQTASGCAPLVISFQDLSTGTPTAWKWDFGNGNTSTLQNPSATYFQPGTYTITLTATNASGSNTLTRSGYITIYDKPKVDFSADVTNGCFPLPVQFTDASVPSAGTSNVNWQWDFGNGLQATDQSPQVTYTAAGQYTVSLKVTNDKGCYATFTRPSYIQIPTGINVGFTNTPIDRCKGPFPVTFNNTTSGPGNLTYTWDFGDGATSDQTTATHAYAAPGKYTVTLSVTSTNGCKVSLPKPDLINIPSVATSFSAPDSICILSPASFSNTATPAPASAQWDFGDGSTASAIDASTTYSTAGSYTVRLVNNYGFCTDSFSKVIRALPLPKAAFTSPNTLQCKPPLTVQFNDASSNAVSWSWDFGDGTTSTGQNPSHTYDQYGDFDVLLAVTNSSGCTDTVRKKAFVRVQKPVTTFPSLPQAGCIPYTTGFSANVQTLDKVTSYLWDFGDGTTSTVATPTHTYPVQGNYAVSLVVTTSTGCTDSLRLPNAIVVGRKPVIDFTITPNPVCALQPVSFTGITNEGDTWAWNFGDGQTSNVQNPTHAYSDTGLFTIKLTVTNNGCPETLTRNNLLRVKPPIPKFIVQKICGSKKEFLFTDASVGAQFWQWDFGDGTTSTLQSPKHIYKDYGTYLATLTVTNGTCSNSYSVQVLAFDISTKFSADVREACKTATISYTSLLNDPTKVSTYYWDFGNGQTSRDANPQAVYNKAGNFTTTLITTDIYGCPDTATAVNYIRINGPTANFIALNTTGCKGIKAQFTDKSVGDGLHPVTQWEWSYGDGQTGRFQTATGFQHVYSDTGKFAVQLTVTDSKGCKDSVFLPNAVITTDPNVNFDSPDTLTCLGSSVHFNDLSDSAAHTTAWTFGDGTMSTAASPVHLYKDTGAYTIQLIVKDTNGCIDSLTRKTYINIHKTSASFNVSDSIGGCVPYEVRFTNTSSFYSSSLWQFGPSVGTTANPVFTYTLPGSYVVRLLVTGRGGCVDTARQNIVIYPDSVHKFSYTPFDACKPLLLHTSIQSPANMTYSWDFGDGSIVTTKQKDTTHLYQTFGSFLPRLIISDSGNCLLPYTGVDTVFVRGANAKFGVDKLLFCDSGTIQMIDSTLGNEPITQYNWNFGDGGTATTQNPSHFYPRAGLFPVTLVTITSSMCRDTFTLKTPIKVVQSPSIAIIGDSVFCSNEWVLNRGINLRIDTSAIQWFWQFPNGNTASVMLPPVQQYTTAGDFSIEAIAVNSSGCVDSTSKNIHVNPLPVITAPATVTSLVGTPVQIQPVTYSSNVVSYSWAPVTGLSCTTCPQPIAKPNFSTTYQVVATDSNGCRNEASIQVIVLCENANVFVPNTFSPNGDGRNDVFYVRGSGLARVKSLRIFNRLGEIIFERQNFVANDASKGWDGTYKGRKLSPDTYVYQLDVFCDNSETIRVDGSLTLIR